MILKTTSGKTFRRKILPGFDISRVFMQKVMAFGLVVANVSLAWPLFGNVKAWHVYIVRIAWPLYGGLAVGVLLNRRDWDDEREVLLRKPSVAVETDENKVD